jgi:N6-L-threonylcarbamoyladenine synthase
MLYMGIDTSMYTTSIAAVNEDKQLVLEERRLLPVPPGERGLAQSEALFKHIQVLPELFQSVPLSVWRQIKGIGVSTAPRPLQGSYMPVFTAGLSAATSLAAALGAELTTTSHQEGHIAAGLGSLAEIPPEEFLAVHLSGGTTELLVVKKSGPGKFAVQILGESTDLHAGQFIDRVGVRLGLPFPAGKEMEKLALKAAPGAASLLPSSVKGYEMSFSGGESAAQRLIEEKKRPADLARAVEGCIVRTLVKVLEKAVGDVGLRNILIVGGVASNKYIRNELEKKIGARSRLYWAKPEWSSDNAVGVALIAREVQTGTIIK